MPSLINAPAPEDAPDRPSASLLNRIARNPVGTEYDGPSMGQQRGPFDAIVAMTPQGPTMQSALDVAHAQIAQAMELAPTMALGMVGDAPGAKPPGFTAYHGSPHSFDAFDSSKIGTGEGAQAYGHGLYVAGAEDVARTYRDQLGRTKGPLAGDLKAAYDDFQGNLQELWSLKQKGAPVPQELADRIEASQTKYSDLHANAGHMYEVQVNADPAHFLDWDKPLSEQTPHVQEALAKLTKGMKPEEYSMPVNNPDGSIEHGAWGSTIYQGLARKNGARVNNSFGYGDEGTSQMLRDAGIPGIRYLDQGSRASGEGTHNHVIFDADTMAILRKYGLAGLMAGGAAAATQAPQQ